MIKENENIIFEGIYSHFSNSLASDNSFSNIQYERLINVIEKIEKEKITFKYKHICNSSGFFKYKDKHLNAARVGSAFSGCATGIKTDLKKIGLFHTKLTKVRNIKKGDYVGYANSYIAKKDMKIGILETGYYDGVGLELITQRFKFKSRLKNALLSLKSLIKGDNMTKSFEEKLEELEKLVKQLESDNVPLKEAVELYTQANILLKECNTELNDTKATIQKISEDGALEEF